MPKIPTNALLESFEKYCQAIRQTKPRFIRFKDGKLIKNALNHISKFQIEILFLWFLKEKKTHAADYRGGAFQRDYQ